MLTFIVSLVIMIAVLTVCGRWYTRKERELRANADAGRGD